MIDGRGLSPAVAIKTKISACGFATFCLCLFGSLILDLAIFDFL
jgi:hypothetical protein